MYNQLLEDSFPNLIDHRDQTREDHTLDLHVELLELFLNFECCLRFISKERDHHVNKRIGFILLRSREDSQKVR
jgi:hypothetical protein